MRLVSYRVDDAIVGGVLVTGASGLVGGATTCALASRADGVASAFEAPA